MTEIVALIQERATTAAKDAGDGGENVNATKLADETMTAMDKLRKLTQSTAKEFVNSDYFKPFEELLVRPLLNCRYRSTLRESCFVRRTASAVDCL